MANGSYVFNPNLAPEHAIAYENEQVVRQKKYVTVALLTAMTASASSDVSLSRIKDQLAGAHAAQLAANGSNPAQASPAIQLVLANEGTSQELAHGQVTSLLKKMKAAPTNLRAVIGMGASVTPTIADAQALGDAGIPMIGSVITADQLDATNIKGLSRVVPDVAEEITALKQYYQAHGAWGLPSWSRTATPATSTRWTSRTISSRPSASTSTPRRRTGRIPACPPSSGSSETTSAQQAPGRRPRCSMQAVRPRCPVHQGPGAGSQLRQQVGDRGDRRRRDRPRPGLTANQPRQGHVTVICTDIENPNPGAVTADVRQIFAGIPGGTASLADSWTIATYNAMTAAAVAISDAAVGSPAGIPKLSSVWDIVPNLNHASQVAGATGPFSIGPDGNVINPTIPVLEITNGTERQLQ